MFMVGEQMKKIMIILALALTTVISIGVVNAMIQPMADYYTVTSAPDYVVFADGGKISKVRLSVTCGVRNGVIESVSPHWDYHEATGHDVNLGTPILQFRTSTSVSYKGSYLIYGINRQNFTSGFSTATYYA